MKKKIYDFYEKQSNSEKIIQQLYNREFSFFFPRHLQTEGGYQGQRFIKLIEKDKLSWVFAWSRQQRFKKPLNLFMSLAKFNGIPSMKWKREQNMDFRKFWKDNWIKNIYSYDFVIDIDAPTHDDMDTAKEDTLKVFYYLEDFFGKRGQIRFSGKGFHIYYFYDMIDDFFPLHSFDTQDNNNIYDMYCFIAKKIKEEISDYVDTSIYDVKRIIKIPASLVFYPDDKIYYACVLTERQLIDFDLKKYEVGLNG